MSSTDAATDRRADAWARHARRRDRLANVAIAALLLIGSGPIAPAHAHAPEQSYVFLYVADDSIEGRIEMTVADLNAGLGFDFPLDGSASATDVGERLEAIVDYLRDTVGFAPDGVPAAIEVTGHGLHTVSFGQFATIEFRLPASSQLARFIDVEYGALLDELPGHRGLLVVAQNWKTGTLDNESQVSLVFSPSNREQRLDLSSGSTWRGFRAFVEIGAHHIWIGIDHILFLVALLLPSVVRRGPRGWEPVGTARAALVELVKIVTLFTVAHSITLGLAALGYIGLPSRLVESVIALSIAIAAGNILYPIVRRHVGWIVFGFGLFHGLGFASVLGEIGIPGKYVPISLLGFNVGVELGQLAIVCAAFPLLFLPRDTGFYRRGVLVIGPAALIVVSMYWFTERAFDVDLPAGAMLNSIIAAVM